MSQYDCTLSLYDVEQLETLERELEAQQVAIVAFERSKIGSAGYTPSGTHKIPDFPTASELLLTAHKSALQHNDNENENNHEHDHNHNASISVHEEMIEDNTNAAMARGSVTINKLTPLPLSTTTPSTSPGNHTVNNSIRYLSVRTGDEEDTKLDAPFPSSSPTTASPSSPSSSSIRASHEKIKESLTNLRELIQSNFVISTESTKSPRSNTHSDSKKVTTELIAQYRNVLEQYHKLQRDYTETQRQSSQRHEEMMRLKKDHESIMATNERLRYEMERMKTEFESKQAETESAIDKQKVKAISHYLEHNNQKMETLHSSPSPHGHDPQAIASITSSVAEPLSVNVLSKEPLPSSQSPQMPSSQRMLLLHATNSGDTLMSNTTGSVSSNPHSRESSESQSVSTTNPELVVTDDMSFRSHSSGVGGPPSFLDGSMTVSSYNSAVSNPSSLPLSMQRNYYEHHHQSVVDNHGHSVPVPSSAKKSKETSTAKQEEWRKGLRQRFELIDTDHDGFISLDDFVAFTKQKNPNSSEDQITKIFDQMDTRNNGRVTWVEFEKCFRRFAMKNMALKRLPIAGSKVDVESEFDENGEFSKLGTKGKLHAIRVWYDNVIYGFKCTWIRKSSSTPTKMKQIVGTAHLPSSFDATQCTEDVFMLRPDEYISCVTVWIGKEQHCVYGITFETTQNRWHEFGGGMGTPILLQPPEKHAIHAFYGGMGRNLNYIGAYALPRKDHHHHHSHHHRRKSSRGTRHRRSSTSKSFSKSKSKSKSKSQSVSQSASKSMTSKSGKIGSSSGKRLRAATTATVTKSASPPSLLQNKYPINTQTAKSGPHSLSNQSGGGGGGHHVHSQSAFVVSQKQQSPFGGHRMGIPTLSQVENTGNGGIQIAKGLELKDLSRPRNEMDSPTSHYRNATDMTMMSSGKSQSRSPPAQFKRAQSVYDIQSSPKEHASSPRPRVRSTEKPFTVQVDPPMLSADDRKKSKKFSLWWGKK